MPTPKKPLDRRKRKPSVQCPFCGGTLPDPEPLHQVFSAGGALGGRCVCGAVFCVDETGRQGGVALLDAQALACNGDLERAMALDVSAQAQVVTRPWVLLGAHRVSRPRGPAYGDPHVWILKLKA
jgi:hypothetical protein